MNLKEHVIKMIIAAVILTSASLTIHTSSDINRVYAAERSNNPDIFSPYLYRNQSKQITDIVKDKNGCWYYTTNGKINYSYTGLARNKYGWWYINSGKVDFTYNGFVENTNGWWFCRNGKVDFNTSDIIKGTVKGQTGWWFVKNSKVQFINSIERNKNGWWYIKNGKVDFSFTGLAQNKNGWWYCKNGKVDFNKTEVLKGSVNGETGWYNIQNGKVALNKKTSIGSNKNGTWYCENGKVTFSSTGYYVEDKKTYIYKNSKLINIANHPVSLTKLTGYYVSPMYAGNFNSSEERIEAMIKCAYDYLNAKTQYMTCTSKRPGETADCSGLVMQCLYAAGFDPYPATPAHHALPENEYDSRTLWRSVKMKHIDVRKGYVKYAKKGRIDMTKLKRGDLIFYVNTEYDDINHVAIYLGNGEVIESIPPCVVDHLGIFDIEHDTIYGVARPFE